MKKILSVVLLATMVASVNAEMQTPKVETTEKNAVVAHLENNWGKYAAGTAGLTIIAAGLFDYYKNDAKVMNAFFAITKDYFFTIKNNPSTKKVLALCKKHPVIVISALTGAALIVAEGLDINKNGYDKSVLGTSLKATETFVVDTSKAAIDPEKNGWKATKDFSSKNWNKLSEKMHNISFKKKEGVETPAQN
ncbi:MAG: hypothetical protein SZ59_C0001G0207 [candidate division TM6 bacterium GW2011_GWF2_28_16]|nr:MAG: hypothetical protein SZ59_C0001G0207 [candidate division TM6 bacterium GW2011_GWF2_28_16]